MITQNYLKETFNFDPETGIFVRIKNNRVVASHHCRGYIQISINRKAYLAHRVAWLYVYGEWPKNQIDHIDHDRTNNRIANLRDVSGHCNQQNRKIAAVNNKDGLLGAHLDKRTGRFNAHITINGKSRHIGAFDSKEKAHRAYVAVKRIYHGGNTL